MMDVILAVVFGAVIIVIVGPLLIQILIWSCAAWRGLFEMLLDKFRGVW